MDKEHPFSIVVFQNNKVDGKFLLFKNLRWKCALFPNYKIKAGIFNEETERQSIMDFINRDTPFEIDEAKYLGDLVNSKRSVADKIIKKYHFYFFMVYSNKNSPVNDKNIKSKPFSYNGKNFCWMTLDQMYKNRKIKKSNEDVLDYIRANISMS